MAAYVDAEKRCVGQRQSLANSEILLPLPPEDHDRCSDQFFDLVSR